MKSGKITLARDQVLTTFFSFFLFIVWTRPRSRASMNGPFLRDRDIAYSCLALAVPGAHDEAPGGLVASGAMAHRGLAPWCLGRHAGGRLALATTMRMVTRVHHHTAHLRSLAHVTGATGLADALVLMVQI